MKIQMILESYEECLSIERYIRYLLDESDLEFRFYEFKDFIKRVPREFVEQSCDLTILGSHYEDEQSGKIFIRPFGFELLELLSRRQLPVLILYERHNGQLPTQLLFIFEILSNAEGLNQRIKKVLKERVIPSKDQLDILKKIYPPQKYDDHHH